MNINKRFLRVPKSPPRKIMMDLQKERLIRTGTIPHSSDETKKTSKSVVKRRVRNSRKAKKQVSAMEFTEPS
jgi:transposase-like protein